MEPNKINYRDLYPFDDDVIEEVSTIIGKDCPEHDLLIAKLKKYDKQTFCNSLLFVAIYHLIHSYPIIYDHFLQSEVKSEEKLNSLTFDLVFLDCSDDPSQCSSESLKGVVNLALLQGEYVLFRKLKKIIPTFLRDNAHRVYKLLQEANRFRIVELFKILYKKVSENGSTNSRISIFDYWDIDKKFDVGELLIGIHINSYLSEIIIKNNQEKYDKFKQDIEGWGFCMPAFQTYTIDDRNHTITNSFIQHLLIHEGLFVKLFFKYVLSQEDLPVDELDLIYEFLAKNHVSALAEKEYNKYKDHYGWPERQFLHDEPIEGAVEDAKEEALEKGISSEMLSENNNGISLATMPCLPKEYIKGYCKQFNYYCKEVNPEIIEYLFWKDVYDKSISAVKDDIKIKWGGSDVEFQAFIYFLFAPYRKKQKNKNLPPGFKKKINSLFLNKKDKAMFKGNDSISRCEEHMETLRRKLDWSED